MAQRHQACLVGLESLRCPGKSPSPQQSQPGLAPPWDEALGSDDYWKVRAAGFQPQVCSGLTGYIPHHSPKRICLRLQSIPLSTLFCEEGTEPIRSSIFFRVDPGTGTVGAQ